jgi:hypothetical protein
MLLEEVGELLDLRKLRVALEVVIPKNNGVLNLLKNILNHLA